MAELMHSKSWKDLSTGRKATFPLLGIVQVGLLAAALWDLRRRSEDQVNGSKRMWMMLVFVNYVGPIAYFLFGRKKQESSPDWDAPVPA